MDDNDQNNKNNEENLRETADQSGNLQEKIKQLEEELKKCQDSRQEYLDGWQRAKADLINARKDDDRRNQEFLRFANANLILELLSVLDSFNLAFNDSNGPQPSKGIFLIKMQLEDILKKYGLETIKTTGNKIDLQFHEIVGEIESKEEGGVILEELQGGYLLNGKILRPARVKIAKSKKTN